MRYKHNFLNHQDTAEAQTTLATIDVGNNSNRGSGGTSVFSENLRTLTDALTVELPIAAARALLTREGERRVRECSWRAYDAWIALVNEATNRFYKSGIVSRMAGRMLERVMRSRQIGDAMAGAAFALLWPAVGLPTAAQVLKLEDHIVALREELRARIAEQEERDQAAFSAQTSARNGLMRESARQEFGMKAPADGLLNDALAAGWSGAFTCLPLGVEGTADVNI